MVEIKARSRTGCKTCKVRRIKCDEQKPKCLRCISTGRHCDGYTDLYITQHVPLFKILSGTPRLSPDECQCLEFFQHHTIPGLGTDLTSYLLPAAYSNPTIRSVAIAVGSVHRSFAFIGQNDPSSSFALRYYNQAIRKLVASQASSDVVLLACMLFFCCECLQGRYKVAKQHATSGLRILLQQQFLSDTSPGKAPAAVSYLFHTLESQMFEIEGPAAGHFETQNVMLSTCSNSGPTPVGMPLIEQFRRSFEWLYNRFMGLDAVAEALESSKADTTEVIAEIQHQCAQFYRIRADLKTWMNEFDKQYPLIVQASSHADSTTIAILSMWKRLMSMYLRMDWPPSELVWDRFQNDLQCIVSLASSIINPPNTPTEHCNSSETTADQPGINKFLPLRPKPSAPAQATFSLTLGIITPLYICATRCRDSTIRHRAIDLLSRCRRREGLWDSGLAARVAKRITEIEEERAGIKPGAFYRPVDISLAARVRSSSPQFEDGRQATLRYVGGDGDGTELVETIVW